MPFIVLNLTYTPGSSTHKPTARYMQFGEPVDTLEEARKAGNRPPSSF